jgi:hypothetical protein
MNFGTTGLTLCHGAIAHQLVRTAAALRADEAPRRSQQCVERVLDILTIV